MDLITATSRVKKALSSRDYIAGFTHLHLRNGRVYASDGALTASAPIDESLEHVVPAEEFDKACQIFSSAAKYEWSTETLVIKEGRRRMTIRLLPPDQVSLTEPVEDSQLLPPDFKQRIKSIRPFISDDASRPWALTAWIKLNRDGKTVLLATNNITVVEVYLEGLSAIDPKIDVQIPNIALDFLLERSEDVRRIGVAENKVTFWLEDKSQLTCQLFATKMQEQVHNILDTPDETGVPPEEWFQLMPEWREAYKTITQLSPEEIVLGPELMSAGKKQATLEIAVTTQAPRDTTKAASYWNPKFLTPVVEAASFIDFGAYPKPSRFYGPCIRGLIVGKLV